MRIAVPSPSISTLNIRKLVQPRAASAISPDGQFLAIASSNTVVVWDLKHGKSIGTLYGHNARVRALAFGSKRPHLLVSGSNDHDVRVWDVDRLPSDASIQILREHNSSVISVAFSPSGKLLAAGSDNHVLFVWQASDHENAAIDDQSGLKVDASLNNATNSRADSSINRDSNVSQQHRMRNSPTSIQAPQNSSNGSIQNASKLPLSTVKNSPAHASESRTRIAPSKSADKGSQSSRTTMESSQIASESEKANAPTPVFYVNIGYVSTVKSQDAISRLAVLGITATSRLVHDANNKDADEVMLRCGPFHSRVEAETVVSRLQQNGYANATLHVAGFFERLQDVFK